MRVIGGERDALAGRLVGRNIWGLDQRLRRHADQGHRLGRGAGGASDQCHHPGVSAAIDKDGAGRPTRSEEASADQLGQLWRNGRVECVRAATNQNDRRRRGDAERVVQRSYILISLPDDRCKAL
jgi:hypothetical protein